MKDAIGYIIIGVCLAIGVIIGLRGCGKEPPDHTQLLQKNDSLVKVITTQVAAAFKYKDSTNRVISVLQNDKDSLTSIVISYEKSLAKQSKDISGLIEDLDDAEAKKDTVGSLHTCDSLKYAVLNAKGIVNSYIVSNDSLRKLNDQIIASKTEIINRLGQQLTETNQSFFSTQLTLQKIESDYNKLRSSSKKRFSFGPSFGGFATKEGFRPAIGIGVTYSLIKF